MTKKAATFSAVIIAVLGLVVLMVWGEFRQSTFSVETEVADLPAMTSGSETLSASSQAIDEGSPEESRVGTAIEREPATHERSEFPAIMMPAKEVSLQVLRPWIDEFVQKRHAGGPIIEYEIVSFDDDYIRKLKHGEEDSFSFNFNNSYTFEVSIDEVVEGNTFWFANGYVPDRSDGSAVRLFVFENGTKEGSLHIMGVGSFYIKPTPDLRHHIVFLLTGTYEID